MINILKYINIPVFIISFVIGMLIVCFMMPDMRKIYVYPTPENIDILQYKDRTGSCFQFKQKEVPCPTDDNAITNIPMQ